MPVQKLQQHSLQACRLGRVLAYPQAGQLFLLSSCNFTISTRQRRFGGGRVGGGRRHNGGEGVPTATQRVGPRAGPPRQPCTGGSRRPAPLGVQRACGDQCAWHARVRRGCSSSISTPRFCDAPLFLHTSAGFLPGRRGAGASDRDRRICNSLNPRPSVWLSRRTAHPSPSRLFY